MRAIRLPLLCAFAGGCLSNALLFFLWRSPESASSPALEQHRTHHLVALAAATAAPDAPASELDPARAAEDGAHAAEPAPPATPATADNNADAPPPAGSAVSDVLTSLEAAYRERVSARAPAQPAQAPEPATAATPANTAVATPEPAPRAAPPSGVEVPPRPATVEARAAAPESTGSTTPATPAAVAPQMAAAIAPQAPPAPAFAAEDSPPPAQIHYGDVNQNTYITNIRQGDVYLIQLQQLAVLQYMQMLGASANAAPALRHARGAPPPRPFSSGIINPDNPWGFHFTPPNLVR